jgi:hypothetical protein
MDVLNDYYPLYLPNPDRIGLTDIELAEDQEYREFLNTRRANLHYDDWYLKYSDDLWQLWNMINEYTYYNTSPILNGMQYFDFCDMCYNNSTKY